MNPKIIYLISLMLFSNILSAQELNYIVTESNTIDGKKLPKGAEVIHYIDTDFVGGNLNDYNFTTEIEVHPINLEESLYISCDYLELKKKPLHLPQPFNNSIWVMSYYFDILQYKSNERIKSYIFNQDKSWNTWEKTLHRNEPGPYREWYEDFQTLYILLKPNLIVTSRSPYHDFTRLLVDSIAIKANNIKFSIISNAYDDNTLIQSGYEQIISHSSPYNLIFVQDGDYLDMYIDSVRSSNHIFTYVRGTKEMAKEIEHFVRREPYDSSKILWPRHANGTSDYDDETILDHKTGNAYLTLHNTTIRTEPDSNSDIVSDIKKDDVVTILEKANSVTINDIQSNWLKVKTDNNQTGWVFGGDISLNDTTSREEQEQYEAEHAELLEAAQQYQENQERLKTEQAIKEAEEQKKLEEQRQILLEEVEKNANLVKRPLDDFIYYGTIFLFFLFIFLILIGITYLIVRLVKSKRNKK
ncbi:SH3 domain-containing protein [Spirochaeta cellobiosiphila]|uniref:SH3 domain-containing protein n=1 Tax=Spirochaeta cellobiosiphila TaxID=504483 RepID=UPI000418F83F|nr:SH3 domain-containing protein [Spirochaeta cellobiosiphila]